MVVFNNNNYNRLQHMPEVHFWFRLHCRTPRTLFPGFGYVPELRVVDEKVCGFRYVGGALVF